MISTTLKILQVNVNRSAPATESALQLAIEAKVDLIAVQEPWFFNTPPPNTELAVSTQHPAFIQILPRCTALRARTLVYVLRGIRPLVSLASNSPDDPDIQIIDIVEGQSKVQLINIYNEADQRHQGPQTLPRCLYPLQIHPRTVILGDFNTHHPDWDPLSPRESPGSHQLVDYIDDNDLRLLNTPGDFTFFRSGSPPSVLDLTLATAPLAPSIVDWQVTPDLGSDHLGICFTIQGQGGATSVNPLHTQRFDTAKADWPAFRASLGVQFSQRALDLTKTQGYLEADQENARGLVLRNDSLMGNEVLQELEQAAIRLTEVISSAASTNIPLKRHCPSPKPWWNEDLKDLRQTMSRLQRTLQPHDLDSIRVYLLAKNSYFSAIKLAKRRHWNQFLEKEDPKSIFRAMSYTKDNKIAPLPTIRGQETFEGKCRELRQGLFPPPPSTTSPNWSNYKASQSWEWPELSRIELQTACSIAAIKGKSPGPDQITQDIIHQAYEAVPDEFFKLFYCLLDVGYHPRIWRQATGAILKKSAKPDYSVPKAYRVISLLNCLGKVSERVLAKRLGYLAETTALLHPSQIGGRLKKSAIDAALLLASDVESNKKANRKTTTLFLDVKGAFDHVSKYQLLSKLKDLRLPASLIAWVSTFLSERTIRLAFDGQTEEFTDIETGIPQGSPISPILFLIYIRDLFNSQVVKFLSYIDDISLSYSSTSLKKNVKVLAAIVSQLYALAEQNAIQFDLDKTELIHWNRGKLANTVSLTLPNGDKVQPSKVVKWLGIHFDQGLTFREHVRIKTAKARQAFLRLERLTNTEKGLSPYAFRQLYLACVASIADYGTELWFKEQPGHINTLQKLQNIGLRKILGAFKTSPTTKLELESAIPPVKVRLQATVRRYAFRLAKLSDNHPVNRYFATVGSRAQDSKPTQLDRIRESIEGIVDMSKLEPIRHFHFAPWDKEMPFEVHIPNQCKDDQAKAHLSQIRQSQLTKTTVIYTDASETASSTGIGVGIVAYDLEKGGQIETQKLVNIGPNQLVYNGELEGTTLAMEYASRKASAGRHFTIYSDNQAGLYRLRTPSDNPGQSNQIRAITAARQIKAKGASITLEWVPGHTDIEGNERADRLAKRASTFNHPPANSRPISWAIFGTKIKRERQNHWENTIRAADRKRGFRERQYKLRASLIVPQGTKRLAASTFYQLKLGHGYLKSYLARIGRSLSDRCECGARETTEHLLISCNRLVEERKALREDLNGIRPSKDVLFGTQLGVKATLSFITKYRVGTRAWHLERVEREAAIVGAGEEAGEGEGG